MLDVWGSRVDPGKLLEFWENSKSCWNLGNNPRSGCAFEQGTLRFQRPARDVHKAKRNEKANGEEMKVNGKKKERRKGNKWIKGRKKWTQGKRKEPIWERK